jgi:hypothetical protein
MKKLLFSLLIIGAFLSVVPSADALLCMSSGLKTADALISNSTKALCGVLVITNGTDAATAIVYDNASGPSGRVLFKGKISGAANFGGATFENPVNVDKGIYVVITGTGASYIIYYLK